MKSNMNGTKTMGMFKEDVLEKRLGDVFEEILNMPLKNILRIHLQDVFGRRPANTSWRRLAGVLEDEKLFG